MPARVTRITHLVQVGGLGPRPWRLLVELPVLEGRPATPDQIRGRAYDALEAAGVILPEGAGFEYIGLVAIAR